MKTRVWAILVLGLVIASGTTGCAATKAAEGVPPDDRLAILDLIANYAYTYDARDLDGFLALLTEGCLWEAYAGSADRPVLSVTSRSDLREVITQRFAELERKGVQSRHYQTSTVLRPQADGSIAGTTMLVLVWQMAGERPIIVSTGIYRDEFVRADTGWRFRRRALHMDQAGFSK